MRTTGSWKSRRGRRGTSGMGLCLLPVLAPLVGGLLLLAALAGAAGAQVPGATYKGTTSRGGLVGLEVSADGGTVTHISFYLTLPCGSAFSTSGLGGHAIVDHAFSYNDETDPNLTYSGSFSGQRVQGTLSYRSPSDSSCNVDLTWTAGVVHTLTVIVVGASPTVSGTGEVFIDPPGMTCGGIEKTCSEQFSGSVTLTARPGTRYFVGWSGAGCTGTGKCRLQMDADKSVTATFKQWTGKITKHPGKRTTTRTATFAFTSSVRGATFKCNLDQARSFKPCASPKTYRNLAPGPHFFEVQAYRAGRKGPLASYNWTVLAHTA